MIRICPERDGRCPHGMDCPFSIDRYRCDIEKSREALKAPGKPMTDISESGIEPALDEAALWDEGFTSHPREYQVLRMDGDDIQTVSRHPDRGAMEDALKAARMRAAIQAYLPFHPPASREEGLREAAEVIERYVIEEQPGDVKTVLARKMAASILALIPTKPEAKESHWAARNEPDYADPARPPGAYATESKKPE